MTLHGKRIAILSTDGFEQSELLTPRERLSEAGADVTVVSPKTGEIRGWDGDDWGKTVPVDRPLSTATAGDYDALVLPGGQINPDKLRVNDDAIAFIKAFDTARKPIAAICHAPWLLIEAEIAEGRRMTSFASIRTDVANAGATWVDAPVVVDQGIVTSRHPGDLDAFCDKVVEEVREGRHEDRAVA